MAMVCARLISRHPACRLTTILSTLLIQRRSLWRNSGSLKSGVLVITMKIIMRTKKGIFITPLSAKSSSAPRCFLCGDDRLTDYAVIAQKPARETDFYIKPEDYLRRIMVCRDCGVFVNLHAYDLDHL